MPEEKTIEMPKTEMEADELANKAGLFSGELGEKGEVVFGDGCLILSQVEGEHGKKLKLTVQQSKCGQVMGEQLIKYLIESPGEEMAIEIIKDKVEPKVEPVKGS